MARMNILVVSSAILLLSFFKVGAFPSNEAVVEAKQTTETLTAQTTKACIQHGGLCVIKSECPKDKLSSTLGLCGQGNKECCFSLPTSIVDCEQRGGICRPTSECKSSIIRDPLGKCDTGKVCCILVN